MWQVRLRARGMRGHSAQKKVKAAPAMTGDPQTGLRCVKSEFICFFGENEPRSSLVLRPD